MTKILEHPVVELVRRVREEHERLKDDPAHTEIMAASIERIGYEIFGNAATGVNAEQAAHAAHVQSNCEACAQAEFELITEIPRLSASVQKPMEEGVSFPEFVPADDDLFPSEEDDVLQRVVAEQEIPELELLQTLIREKLPEMDPLIPAFGPVDLPEIPADHPLHPYACLKGALEAVKNIPMFLSLPRPLTMRCSDDGSIAFTEHPGYGYPTGSIQRSLGDFILFTRKDDAEAAWQWIAAALRKYPDLFRDYARAFPDDTYESEHLLNGRLKIEMD